MWCNPSNNYEEYFREHRESESSQWRIQTPMESYNHSAPRTSEERPSNVQDEPRPVVPQSRTAVLIQDRPFSLETGQLDRPFRLQTGRSDSRPAVSLSRPAVLPMDQVWTDFESHTNDAFHQSPPYSQCQEDEWNHQHHYEPSNEEMEYGWNHECQYYPSNEEMRYMEEYGYQQESFDSNLYYHNSGVEDHQEYENPEMTSILQQLLEGQERVDKKIEEAMDEISERLDDLALRYDSLKAKVEIEEASKYEDMDEDIETWNSFPEEYNVVDEHPEDYTQLQSLYEDDEESIQFQEEESNEDVRDAQFPLKEEIQEVPKDAEMTQEGEVVVFFPTIYEIVVEHEEDQIYTQQQSPAGEEVVEIIQLHEDALDEDALALIVAVMNKETLRYNNASTNVTNKEEEEVVQLFELPQKELHQDEAMELRVPESPTPRIQYPQGLRKRLEWRIKHKWKIKLHNV